MRPRLAAAVFRKELGSYFATPLGFVFILFYLLVSNGLFLFFLGGGFFRVGQASMRLYFEMLPWLLLVFAPLVTMRLWAEEKKLGTLELLLTMPLRESEVVAGKFAAALCFMGLTFLLSLTLPVSMMLLGRPDAGVMAGSYVAAFLMAGAYLAIGAYIGSLTENQVLAFIGSFAVLMLVLLAGWIPVQLGLLGAPVAVLEYLSLYSHFQNILRGVIDSRDVVYYLGVTVFFLYLNARNIEARKWR